MRRPRGPRSLRGVLAALVAALGLVLALLITVALLGMITTARDYRDGAERALQRQTAANALLIDLLNAQSANRAYILLARGDDLAAYLAARGRYPAEMAALNRALGRRARAGGLRRRRRPHRGPLVPGGRRADPAAAPGSRRGGAPAHQPGAQRGALQRVPRRARRPGGWRRGRAREGARRQRPPPPLDLLRDRRGGGADPGDGRVRQPPAVAARGRSDRPDRRRCRPRVARPSAPIRSLPTPRP